MSSRILGRILVAAWAPVGLFMDWRYRRYADRLNGGDDA